MFGNKENYMTKVNDLKDRYERLQEERKELQTKRDQLREAISTIKANGIKCAEGGSTEEYRSLSAEAAALEDELFVAERRLDKLREVPFTPAEIREAWDQYHDHFAGDIESKIKQFQKLKASLMDIYRSMIDTQEEAVTIREKLFGYLGIDYKEKPIESILPMKGIPFRTSWEGINGLISMGGTTEKDPDYIYYLADYCARHNINSLQLYASAERARIESIVAQRRKKL